MGLKQKGGRLGRQARKGENSISLYNEQDPPNPNLSVDLRENMETLILTEEKGEEDAGEVLIYALFSIRGLLLVGFYHRWGRLIKLPEMFDV